MSSDSAPDPDPPAPGAPDAMFSIKSLTETGKICYKRFIPNSVMDASIPVTERPITTFANICRDSTANMITVVRAADFHIICDEILFCDVPTDNDIKLIRIIAIANFCGSDNTKVSFRTILNTILILS